MTFSRAYQDPRAPSVCRVVAALTHRGGGGGGGGGGGDGEVWNEVSHIRRMLFISGKAIPIRAGMRKPPSCTKTLLFLLMEVDFLLTSLNTSRFSKTVQLFLAERDVSFQ